MGDGVLSSRDEGLEMICGRLQQVMQVLICKSVLCAEVDWPHHFIARAGLGCKPTPLPAGAVLRV